MNKKDNKVFKFQSTVWLYPTSKAAWHFADVNKKTTDEIRFLLELKKTAFSDVKIKTAAWGSIKVLAQIGATAWQTSIFPDSKNNRYILPLKLDVRKKEKIKEGDKIKITLTLS